MSDSHKTINGIVDGLKAQPLSLALVVVNVVFLVAGGLFVHYLGNAVAIERADRNHILTRLIESCGLPGQSGRQ